MGSNNRNIDIHMDHALGLNFQFYSKSPSFNDMINHEKSNIHNHYTSINEQGQGSHSQLMKPLEFPIIEVVTVSMMIGITMKKIFN